MKRAWEILVADDEEVVRVSLSAWLREDGYQVATAASGAAALEMAEEKRYAVYLIDLKMPGMDGLQTMRELRRLQPDAAVVIITAYATVDTAIAAMKEGAQDYVVKPCNPAEISLLVGRLIRLRLLQQENRLLRKRLSRAYRLEDLVSKNPRMQEIFALIRSVASLRSTVLIQGESGTGKELVARAIHNSGARAKGPFIAVSCAALTDTLLESELFGHEKGAFTGAIDRRKGKFELADGGTIFLDEIGDIPARVQVDLLRVLQERAFFRVGGSEEVRVEVRVIAATNTDLRFAVEGGAFRDDLFYRLNVITIQLPPLRERREDIPLLAQEFVSRLASELGREVSGLSEGAMRLLLDYPWPGNVRELENAVERAIVTCRSRVLTDDDFAFLAAPVTHPGTWRPPTDMALDEVERAVIVATLDGTGGNVKRAAEILKIDRSTLYDRLRRYGLR